MDQVFVVALLAIPLLFVFPSQRLAKDRLRRGIDPVTVLYRLTRFVRYFHTLYVFPFLLSVWGVELFQMRGIRAYWLRLLISLVLALVAYAVLTAEYALTQYSVMKRILDITSTRVKYAGKRFLGALARGSALASLFFLLGYRGPQWTSTHQVVMNVQFLLLVFLATVSLEWVYPYLMRWHKMTAHSIPESWLRLAEQSRLSSVHFYVWRTRDEKIANAMALGFFRRVIVVSDYLLDTFTAEEVEAVIAHELGHLQKKHSLWNFVVMEAWVPLYVALRYLFHFAIPAWLSPLLVLLVLALMYQGIFQHWLSRQFEFQADRHSVELLGKPEQPERVLEKLADIHKSPMVIPEFDELWMTHPSIAHRLERVRAASLTIPQFQPGDDGSKPKEVG